MLDDVTEVPAQREDLDRRQALQELAERVNGFVYHGERLEAVVKTVQVLREHPGLARVLLDGPEN